MLCVSLSCHNVYPCLHYAIFAEFVRIWASYETSASVENKHKTSEPDDTNVYVEDKSKAPLSQPPASCCNILSVPVESTWWEITSTTISDPCRRYNNVLQCAESIWNYYNCVKSIIVANRRCSSRSWISNVKLVELCKCVW